MFKCDDLIYIQLQKTGTTTIAALLCKLFDGEMIGKHNPATPEQLQATPYFISSMRNPWSWYLSLWAFGVQNGGAFMRRLTKQVRHRSNELKMSTEHDGLDDVAEDVKIWRSVYDSSDNVESFRQWLKMIHDPVNAHYLGEGYGHASLNQHCGFMTYRYLCLCCMNLQKIMNVDSNYSFDDLVRFDKEDCYINFFIRQENLEDSLCEAIGHVRSVTDQDRAVIYGAGKSNTSKKMRSISEYYDDDSIEIILKRDKLIVDKFSYEPPR